MVDHIDHIVKIAESTVGIGCDFDGGGIDGVFDVSEIKILQSSSLDEVMMKPKLKNLGWKLITGLQRCKNMHKTAKSSI